MSSFMAAVRLPVWLGLIGLLLFPAAGIAELYRYEGEGGAVIFTDNPSSIPKKYKNKARSHDVDVTPPDLSETPVSIDGNRVLVTVTIDYRGKMVSANLILDTGAEVTTITPALASRLEMSPEAGEVAFAQGVGGGIHKTSRVSLDSLQFGPHKRYNIDALVIKSGSADGLLGMNFLRGLRYQINFDMATIKWVQ